ncbi:hypothetical protein KP509_21G079200 [Ceratopteris richardii]|uniref:Uncharacterized protein n=1 Tax=Ceratopteris richardii TaxID=49495 RepID=A0A8T2SFG0_CERRI|nr:hypothetical protein KP509_21G079200 [Ceratopteris richardii]
MKANRANTTAINQSSLTHATRYAVPASSVFLSSSSAPFVPRSQQQPYFQSSSFGADHVGDFQGLCNHISSWSHGKNEKEYDQPYYTTSGAEQYALSWCQETGTTWDNGTWQPWSDSSGYAYAQGVSENASNHFSSPSSYYTGSPSLVQDIYVCPPSSTVSVIPVMCSSNDGTDLSNLNMEGNIEAKQTSCGKKEGENLVFSYKKSKGQVESSAKGKKQKIEEEAALNNFDEQIHLIQTSGENTGPIQDAKFKLITDVMESVRTEMKGNLSPKTSGDLRKDQGCNEVTEQEHSTSSGLSPLKNNQSIDNSSMRQSTSPPAADMTQKEPGSMRADSENVNINDLQSSCVLSAGVAFSKHVESQDLEQANDLERLCQNNVNSSFIATTDNKSCTNEKHLLVESIYNLSKVLYSQSKDSNALDTSDSSAIEYAIYMLSHRLCSCTVTENNVHQQPICKVADGQVKALGDSRQGISQPIFIQKNSLKIEAENAPYISSDTCVPDGCEKLSLKEHSVWLQEDLRSLREDFQKLQDDIRFERAESNVTVSAYKKLWTEAEDRLKLSMSQISKMETKLAHLEEELVNVKRGGSTHQDHAIRNHEGGTLADVVMDSNQDSPSLDLNGTFSVDRGKAFSGDPKCPSEILTEVSDMGRTFEDGKGGTSLKTFKSDSLQSDLKDLDDCSKKVSEPPASELFSKYTLVPQTNLDGDVAKRLHLLMNRHDTGLERKIKKIDSVPNRNLAVSSDQTIKNTEASRNASAKSNTPMPSMDDEGCVAQRYSLLLSRKNLDAHKGDNEICAEWPSESHEGEGAAPANKKYLYWSEASNLGMDNTVPGCPIEDLNSEKDHISESKDSYYSLVEPDPLYGMEGSFSQEDDMEVICFKPGIVDHNLNCLKGEPEWEDVVINALDDHMSMKGQRI